MELGLELMVFEFFEGLGVRCAMMLSSMKNALAEGKMEKKLKQSKICLGIL